MTTRIYLVRHGMTDWNKKLMIQGRCDIPLNEDGRLQVLQTAKKLKDASLKFDIYLSSPLKRAYDSCLIIKDYFKDDNKDIITIANLTEREFGEADGLIITNEVYQRILKDDYQKMETSSMILSRAKKAIDDIVTRYEGKNILIVTHSHFIKAYLINLDPHLTFQAKLNNASISYLEFDDKKIVKFAINK